MLVIISRRQEPGSRPDIGRLALHDRMPVCREAVGDKTRRLVLGTILLTVRFSRTTATIFVLNGTADGGTGSLCIVKPLDIIQQVLFVQNPFHGLSGAHRHDLGSSIQLIQSHRSH